MRFAGERITRAGGGSPTTFLQLIAAPGDDSSEQRKRGCIDDFCCGEGCWPTDDQTGEEDVECGCKGAGPKPTQGGRNQHRRYKEQIRRLFAQHRREQYASKECKRDG